MTTTARTADLAVSTGTQATGMMACDFFTVDTVWLRRFWVALAGTSANLSGQPTITDPDEVIAVFGQRVSTILLEDFDEVPPERRRSATILDFTQPRPHLVREGSVPAGELAAELRRLGLGELVVGADVQRV